MNQTQVIINLDESARGVCFSVRGEIDHHGAKEIRKQIDEVIAKQHPILVTLDLSGVSFMDSAGLGLILGRYTKVSEYGGKLILLDPSSAIMKILTLSGADKLLTIQHTEKQKGDETK